MSDETAAEWAERVLREAKEQGLTPAIGGVLADYRDRKAAEAVRRAS